MTPAMEPVQEVDEPQREGFRTKPHWPVQGTLGKFAADQSPSQSLPNLPPTVTDIRAEPQQPAAEIRPEETGTGLPKRKEAKATPPAQPSAPVAPADPLTEFLRTGVYMGPIPAKPQRIAPGRRKDAAAEEQLEADDEESKARVVANIFKS